MNVGGFANGQFANVLAKRKPLYCVQGWSDKSLCVRQLQSQQKIQTEIIQTKEKFRRKGFKYFFFSTVSALIVDFGKRLFVTINLVAFILICCRLRIDPSRWRNDRFPSGKFSSADKSLSIPLLLSKPFNNWGYLFSQQCEKLIVFVECFYPEA